MLAAIDRTRRPSAGGRADRARARYRTPEELARPARGPGSRASRSRELDVTAAYADFDEFWQRAGTHGAGPAGAWLAVARRRAARRGAHDELLRQLGEPGRRRSSCTAAPSARAATRA